MAENNPKLPTPAPAQSTRATQMYSGQDRPLGLQDLPDAIRQQSDAWIKEQNNLFAGVQNLWADWMKRQSSSAQAAFGIFQQICDSGGNGDAFAAYQEWLESSMGLFAADMTALSEQATLMTESSQRTLSAFTPTVRSTKAA
jgi:hypothetical protein